MSIRSSSAFIAGAVVALVVGTGTAYAANGGTFRLGMSNSATRTTTLTNNYGPALRLNSKAGQPPLQVNRNTRVPYLNADLLDGLTSTSFARVTNIGSVSGPGFVHDSGTADPADDTVVAVAVCPAGSQVAGGGGGDFTDDGMLFLNAPDGRDAWVVISTTDTATEANAENVEAYARCWNPRAHVTGNMRMAPAPHELSGATLKAIDKVAAKR
jgi:hypothetical protein